jgi:tRNA (Thr-GGU) A37 N-methylase
MEAKHKYFRINPIGFVRSDLKRHEDAPRQGREGAPNALIEVLPLQEGSAPNASR